MFEWVSKESKGQNLKYSTELKTLLDSIIIKKTVTEKSAQTLSIFRQLIIFKEFLSNINNALLLLW